MVRAGFQRPELQHFDAGLPHGLAERIDHLADVPGLVEIFEPLIDDALSRARRQCAFGGDDGNVRKKCTHLPGSSAARIPANDRSVRGEPDEWWRVSASSRGRSAEAPGFPSELY
jgi:hypothetical protein